MTPDGGGLDDGYVDADIHIDVFRCCMLNSVSYDLFVPYTSVDLSDSLLFLHSSNRILCFTNPRF
jgi:hypothetical protein